MTPSQLLRKMARENREMAAKLRERADKHDRWAAENDRQAEEMEAGESGLRIDRTDSIVSPMDVNTESESVRRAAGRATRNHPAQKKLYDAGVTITELAALLKEGRPRVSSWFAEGDANRPIPKRHAERLKEKYGIPLSAWSRVGS